jgi:hypothetical protein
MEVQIGTARQGMARKTRQIEKARQIGKPNHIGKAYSEDNAN